MSDLPRDAATVIIVRDADAGIEVFLMRRSKAVGFLGGMFVFPGGKVDDADRDPILSDLVLGDIAQMPALLDEDIDCATAVSLYAAAMRETIEEAGLLPGQQVDVDGDGVLIPVVDGEAARKRLENESLGALLSDVGARIDLEALVPWSRWITPEVETRRFDARFFLAAVPGCQRGSADGGETDHARWVRPADAIVAHEAGALPMLPPTLMSLRELAGFGDKTVAELLMYAKARKPPRVKPEPVAGATGFMLCFPGDEAHSDATRALPGPTRLRLDEQRWLPG